ncbi:Cda4 (predicted) [Pycnogonum litorale]
MNIPVTGISCMFAFLTNPQIIGAGSIGRGFFTPIACRWSWETYPDSKYCDRYYTCQTGWLTRARCQTGLSFDRNLNTCDLEWRVNCDTRQSRSETETFRCPPHTGIFADPDWCNKYVNCADGIPFRRTCPRGLLFDSYRKVCNVFNKVHCGNRRVDLRQPTGTTRTPKTDGNAFRCPTKQGVFPVKGDCRRFWLCRDYQSLQLHCNSGLQFDSIRRECVLGGRCYNDNQNVIHG